MQVDGRKIRRYSSLLASFEETIVSFIKKLVLYLTSLIYSRNGTELLFPTRCRRILPSTYLDAELWFGRGTFLDSQRFIQGSTADLELLR